MAGAPRIEPRADGEVQRARGGPGSCRLRVPGRLPLVGGSERRLRERPVGVSAFAAQRLLDARIAQPGAPEKQVHCQVQAAQTTVHGKRPVFTLSAQQTRKQAQEERTCPGHRTGAVPKQPRTQLAEPQPGPFSVGTSPRSLCELASD